MLAATAAFPQTLARPGWTGSGFNTDPWWKHAVFYNTGTASTQAVDFKAITTKLDALRSLGVDAVILPTLDLPALDLPAHDLPAHDLPAHDLPAQSSQHAAAAPASNPALDDFDELIHQAGRRNIRVLLTLYAPAASADLSVSARFWLSRGVSGFHVVTAQSVPPQDTQTIVQSLRRITNTAVGGRIVISDLNPAPAFPQSPPPGQYARPTSSYRHTARYADSTASHLQIDSQLDRLPSLDAASIRPVLAQSLLTPNLLLDLSTSFVTTPIYRNQGPPSSAPVVRPDPSLDHARAAILLTTHSAALLGADTTPTPAPTPGPNPTPGPIAIADWYRQLSMLHRGNSTLRTGAVSLLDFDAQNALVWVIRPQAITSLTPPIVVACNLSGSPLHLSLTAPLKAINLRGTFLRTLLRTDTAMGGQDLDYVTLPPHAVYIGELRR